MSNDDATSPACALQSKAGAVSLQPGSYYLHVEAGPNNPADTGNFNLAVNGNYLTPPLSGIQGPSAVAGCTSHTYSTTEGFDSYSWSVPSGAQVASGGGTASITVNFDASSGSVSVTATNSCGSNSADLNVVVAACPTPTPSPTPAPTGKGMGMGMGTSKGMGGLGRKGGKGKSGSGMGRKDASLTATIEAATGESQSPVAARSQPLGPLCHCPAPATMDTSIMRVG